MAVSYKHFVLFFLMVAFGGTVAQDEPVHCCVESQFTVVERVVSGQADVNGSEAIAYMSTRIEANNYDDNEIAAYITETYTNGVVNEYKLLESFDLGFGWIIQNGVCRQFEFEGNMPDNCVPYDRDIQYMGPLRYMGFVPAQSWRMVLWPELGSRGISDFIVAEDGCLPIASSFRGHNNFDEPELNIFESGYFYNFTRGIDKSWFNIPNDCPQLQFRDENGNVREKIPPPLYPAFFRRGSANLPKIISTMMEMDDLSS